MIRTMLAVGAVLTMLAAAGCSGADPGPQGGGGQQNTDPQPGWPDGDNNSDMDDGSYWPRWKNPCPGPACDPYAWHPEWAVDPPPDYAVRPGEQQQNPEPGVIAPKAKTGIAVK